MSTINRYPLWKNLLVMLITAAGLLLALPNLYGDDPAVQVSATNAKVDQGTLQQVEDTLKAAKLDYKSGEVADSRVLVRFADTDTQLKALDAVKQALGTSYNVALNLAPRTPKWMDDLGMRPMSKGLDLQGGVHFQLQVDLNAAAQTKLQRDMNDIRSGMREKLIRYEDISLSGNSIAIQLHTPDDADKARQLLTAQYSDLTVANGSQPNSLTAGLADKDIQALRQSAVEQNITTLRNRVNELGVAEPIVQQQGATSIVVELPGVQDTARAKEILGATATLEFRLVDPTGNPLDAQQTGHVPLDDQLFTMKDTNAPVLLKRDVIVSGEQLVNASSGFDQESGTPDVSVTLNSAGASKMGDTTR
ncbi:MAG TPA: protein translocase subunit SecD, partial [Gammaproteobacteria bacterium]|nr:protein translocase subunit SecD [Gammaproteobacteria bacterium]